MVFVYHCVDGQGTFYDGVIHEDSLEAAREALEAKAWQVLRLEESGRTRRGKKKRPPADEVRLPAAESAPPVKPALADNAELRLSRERLRLFTLQMGVMLGAGIPLLKALNALRSAEFPDLARVADALHDLVHGGHSLSSAMSRLPKAFSPSYLSLVQASEKSGQLGASFQTMAARLERQETRGNRFRQALAYPAMVTFVSLGMLCFLLYYMFPKFAEVFSSTGMELPALTRVVMALSSHTLVPLAVGVLLLQLALHLWRDPEQGRGARVRAWVLYRAPVLGPLNRKAAIGHLCQDLGAMLEAGIPVADALAFVARQPRDDLELGAALKRVHTQLVGGDALNAAMAEEPVFPSLLVSAVAVGCDTGTLDRWFAYISDTLEMEVDLSLSRLTELIEPLTLGVLGVGVGLILMAAFLPIYQMVTVNLA